MKLMVASDIHGSAFYCDKMIRAYERETADKLLLLGDLLYHGPRNDLPEGYNPKESIRMLNEMKREILCVRGNCEAEADQMVLEFPVMAEYMILYIDYHMVFATHGHVHNLDNIPPLKEGDILMHGHTHVQALKQQKGIYYVNPGSVSIPKEGNDNSYMIYEDGEFMIKTLSGIMLSRLKIS